MGGKGKRRNYLLIKIEPIYLPLELKTQSMIHSIEEQKEKKKKKRKITLYPQNTQVHSGSQKFC